MAITPGGRVGDATPLGKPGGKRRLSDYTREIAHALMRNGHPKSEAIAIARSVEKKWAVKSKNPAVRAGAVKATVEDAALSHQKRDMSTSTGNTLDLDWSTFDANRPPGSPGGPPAQPDLLSAQTHNSIAAFQKAHGLPVTGQLDPHTVGWLNDPKNSAAAHAAAAGAAKKAATKSTAAAKKAAALVKKTNAAKVAADKKVAAKNAADTKAGLAAQTKGIAAQKAATLAAASSSASKGKSVVAAGKTSTKSLSTPMVGINDGGRMAGKPAFGGKKAAPFKKGGGRAKQRPGSIATGSGKGKFPITGQKSVNSAAMLIGKAKGVSQKRVAQHIVSEAKKRGLKVPPSTKKKADLAHAVAAIAKERDLDLDWATFDAERGRLGGSRKVSGRPPKRKGKGEHALTPAGLKGKSAPVGKTKISQKDLFAGAQKSALARSRGRKVS